MSGTRLEGFSKSISETRKTSSVIGHTMNFNDSDIFTLLQTIVCNYIQPLSMLLDYGDESRKETRDTINGSRIKC